MPRPRKTVNSRSRFGTVTELPSKKWRARYKSNGGGTKTFATAKEGYDWLAEVQVSMKNNTFVPTTEARQNFGFLAQDWLAGKKNLTPRVAEDYRLVVKRIVEQFGKAKTGSVDYDDVREWIDELEELYGGDRVQKHKMVLSQVFTFAQQRKLRQDNPCDFFQVAGGGRKEEHYLTHQQVQKLAELMRPPYGLVIRLAAYSGLRAGEIWDAKIKSLDFDRRLLQVVSTVGEVKGVGLVSRDVPKNGQWRSARLSSELAEDLRRHCEGRDPNGLIFLSQEGMQVRHRNFSAREWDKPRKKIMTDLDFHDLRHTCAAFHFKAGANAEEVKRILGHSSLSMVSRYAHIFPEAFGSLVDILDADIAHARNELSVQRTTDRTTDPVLIPVEV